MHVHVYDREKIGQPAAELFTCEALESMLSTQGINRASSWKHEGNVMQVIPHNTADSFALHMRQSFDKARDVYDETILRYITSASIDFPKHNKDLIGICSF